MMIRYLKTVLLCAALAAASCIENDIPYPVVELRIAGIAGEGFTTQQIDLANRTVTLQLDEATDIRNVKITSATFDAQYRGPENEKQAYLDQMHTSSPVTGTFDLRTPLYVTLSLYQDYSWTILAAQTIERRLSVGGQVGAARFDTENLIATARVAEGTDLSSLAVTELKLGADAITSYSPSLEELSGSSFESVRFVDVTCHGRTERWTLSVIASDESVVLRQADAWTRVVWLYGEGIAGAGEMGFRYRKKEGGEWADAPGVTVSGGSFSARLIVEPLTTYEITAYCGEEQTAVQEITTESEMPLPNGDLETWSQPKAPWLPFASDAAGNPVEPFWGSGNNGATTLGEKYNLTTPVKDIHPGSPGEYAAQLQSRYVVLKLAAGNLFTGEFSGLRSLSHGIVNFGRPFKLRPTALRLWVKYTPGQFTNKQDIGGIPAGESISVGDYDSGIIYIATGTWTKEEYGYGKDREELFGTDDCPVSIDTRDAKTFFNPNGKDVIGYGVQYFTKEEEQKWNEWRQITIPIQYRATDQRPTHIMVVCSASRWGDYFTGSRDSKMWVDDIELLYD